MHHLPPSVTRCTPDAARCRGALFAFLCAVGIVAAQSETDRDALYVFPDEQASVALVGWRSAWGDSLEWASPSYSDSAWPVVSGVGLWVREGGQGKGVRWYRKDVFLPEPLDSLSSLAVHQRAAVSASELYWDGVLVARNGRIGATAVAEVPGHSALLVTIPAALTRPGRHCVAQRVSNHSTFSGVIEAPGLLLGEFGRLHRSLVRGAAVLLFMAGVFLFTGVLHLILLFGHHRERRPYAHLGFFSLACAAMLLIQAVREYFEMDLAWYYLWAAVSFAPWLAMMTLLPVFFMFEFGFPRRRTLTAVVSAVATVVVGMRGLASTGVLPAQWLGALEAANVMHSYATMGLAAVVSVWAMRRRSVGAVASMVGLAGFFAGVVITERFGLGYGWMMGFTVLLLFLTVSLSREMSKRETAYQEAQVRAARLELDLLKKHIQPHFLLNSLNSIVAWLEEEPSTAVTLVQALAEELRLLLRSAALASVPLAEEVSLCRTHLQVMGLRYGRSYRMETDGALDGVEVPPLVLHTLVENGLTHGYAGRDAGVFRLAVAREGGVTRLELFNDSALEGDAAEYREGTGMRYVRGRLEELYPSRWTFEAGPVEGGWRVVIGIRQKQN